MENKYERSPLYRFFNVIFILVVLFSSLVGYISYTNRELTNARVKCTDGTDWNALEPKNITWNNAALCGVCTKRDDFTKKYMECDYNDPGYYSSHEIINKKYGWSYWIILTPIIIFAVGFAIVDLIKIFVIYIFSGEWAWYKSALLHVLVFFISDNK